MRGNENSAILCSYRLMAALTTDLPPSPLPPRAPPPQAPPPTPCILTLIFQALMSELGTKGSDGFQHSPGILMHRISHYRDNVRSNLCFIGNSQTFTLRSSFRHTHTPGSTHLLERRGSCRTFETSRPARVKLPGRLALLSLRLCSETAVVMVAMG